MNLCYTVANNYENKGEICLKIVGIDLDGTLLNSSQMISQENAAAISQVSEDVFPFICSGRELKDIQRLLQTVNLEMPMVGLNGAVAYDKGKLLYDHAISPEDVSAIHQVVADFPFKLYTNEEKFESKDYVKKATALYQQNSDDFPENSLKYLLKYENVSKGTTFENIDEIYQNRQIKVYKFFVYLPSIPLKQAAMAQLNQIKGINATESAEDNIEIIAGNVSKALAFKQITQHYQFTDPMTVAIGDSLNDLEMIEAADMSFAMANSHPTILEKASHRTVSNDEHGVAQAFKKLQLA